MRRAVLACGLWFFLLCETSAVPRPARAAQQEPDGSAAKEKSLYVPPGPAKDVEVGNFYFKRGNYRAALSRFQEAAHADPTYAPAFLGLGKAYEKIGLKKNALDAYRKYLDDLPSERDAEEAKSVHQAIARLEREIAAGHSGKPAPSH